MRAACARHLDDLAVGHKRGLTWRPALAARAFRFFKHVLRLNGGEHEGKPFELELWQCFIVGSLFGWIGEDGFRRFRKGYGEVGKGNGKSPLAAGIGLYMLTSDGEQRAEIYSAASKQDQALILFRDAVAMVDQSPDLLRRISKIGGERCYNLAFHATASFFRAISSDTSQSGPRPHCGLIDELHEHDDALVLDMMSAGTKFRTQPLIFAITNSGVDRQSVCFREHEYARRIAHREIQNDAVFAYVCAMDEGDEPMIDERCWPKANPNLGVSCTLKYLREQVKEAQGMPAKGSSVRRLNFCQWVDAVNPWIDGPTWREREVAPETFSFAGRDVFAAVDLSGTTDLTALGLLADDEAGRDAAVEFWTPAETLHQRAKRDQVPYDVWVDEGFVTATPGRAVDYAFVAQRLIELQQECNLIGVAFDPYRIKYLEKELDELGAEILLVPHGQGFYRAAESGKDGEKRHLWMPHSIGVLERWIFEKSIRIRRNPCLTHCAASAVLESDPKENKIFTKRKSRGRIDGVVALAMVSGFADGDDRAGQGTIDSWLNSPVVAPAL